MMVYEPVANLGNTRLPGDDLRYSEPEPPEQEDPFLRFLRERKLALAKAQQDAEDIGKRERVAEFFHSLGNIGGVAGRPEQRAFDRSGFSRDRSQAFAPVASLTKDYELGRQARLDSQNAENRAEQLRMQREGQELQRQALQAKLDKMFAPPADTSGEAAALKATALADRHVARFLPKNFEELDYGAAQAAVDQATKQARIATASGSLGLRQQETKRKARKIPANPDLAAYKKYGLEFE